MLQNRKISLKALFTLVFYLIIPAIAITIIMSSYPEISKERFVKMTYYFVPISIVLVIISQYSVKFEKGTIKRLLLNISYVLFTLLWLYGFLGGSLVIDQSWMQYKFSIHLSKYVSLIVFVAIYNVFYYLMEWKTYKDERENKTKIKEMIKDSIGDVHSYIDNKFSIS